MSNDLFKKTEWLGCVLGIACLGAQFIMAQEVTGEQELFAGDSASEIQARWEYFVPIAVPAADIAPDATTTESQPPLLDLVLGPSVFSFARFDLADLRLYDQTGRAIPYSLRYLRPQSERESVLAEEFNRSESPDGTIELTLDLKKDDIQHNEIEIVTSGENFRRAVEIEGSDDGKTFRPLAVGHLVRYAKGDQKLDLPSIDYSDSRFRYLRVRVSRDPEQLDGDQQPDEFLIRDIKVSQQVTLAGSTLTLPGELEPREPVRSYSAPGSAWIIDLGGERIPCDQIEVDIADTEFARDFQIQYELPREPGARVVFESVSLNESFWQRRVGEAKQPMVARFGEVQTGRLKLIVTDHRNPPLTIKSVRFGAPVRQVVFARPTGQSVELRLFYGNPRAEPPNYDFARNLPLKLSVEPARVFYGNIQRNPEFVPPPLAFTERFPWLIYVVLSSVSVILAVMIVSLSRTAIAIHDARNGVQTAS